MTSRENNPCSRRTVLASASQLGSAICAVALRVSPSRTAQRALGPCSNGMGSAFLSCSQDIAGRIAGLFLVFGESFKRVLDSYTSNDVEAGSSNENFRRVWCCVTGLAMYIVRVPGAPMICMTVSETREKRENIYTGRSHVEALECGRPTQLYAS